MSAEASTPPSPESSVRTIQVIAGALILGVSTFLVIALVLGFDKIGGPDPIHLSDPMVLVGLVLALANVALSLVLPPRVVANAIRGLDKGRLSPAAAQAWADWPRFSEATFSAFQTGEIVRLALLEGAALFNGIIGLLTGSLLSFGLMIGLVLLMAITFPTAPRIRDRLDRFREQIEAGSLS